MVLHVEGPVEDPGTRSSTDQSIVVDLKDTKIPDMFSALGLVDELEKHMSFLKVFSIIATCFGSSSP